MHQDWQTSEVPSARKVARKMTKSRWECPADKEHHENIVVEMPLELRGNLDELKKGCRLSRDKAAPAIIKAFRAKYDGIDHPAWKVSYSPRALMERAKHKPGVRPSFQKNYSKRCFSDAVELQLAECAKVADTNKEQWMMTSTARASSW